MAERIEKLESYLSEDSENPQLLISLGDVYHLSGKFSLAKTCYLKATSFEEGSSIARSRMGSLLLSTGKTLDAFEVFQSLISEGENDPVLFHNLAICLFTHSDFERARQTFESLVDVPEVSRSSEFYIASIDDTEDKPELALRRINRLLESGEELYLRGYRTVLLYTLGSVGEAVSEAKRVLADNSNNADAWSVMATLYTEQLKHDDAQRCLQKIIELAPGDARGWHGLGLIELQKRNMGEAISYFEKAISVLPDSSMMLMTLAWAHFCQQNYLAAEQTFNRVIKVNANFGEAWGGLACSLVPQNKIKEAGAASRKASALDKHGFSSLFAKSLLLKVKGKDEIASKLLESVLDQEVRQGGQKYIDLVEQDLMSKNISMQSLMMNKSDKKH
ncbi:MAG: tetratricopeptide repeat protein [Cycloclasticus sp.]